ncbi:MAG: serine protease [Ginsengibacter sp.]
MKKLFTLLFMVSFTLNSYSQEVETLVDFNSLASIYIEAQKGSKPLWAGTGFFLKVKNTIYLITNNHVVGGKYHTDEFKRVHKNDPIRDSLPDILKIRLYDKKLGSFKFETLGLEDAKGNQLYIKIYEDEKNSNSLLDVVAIPIVGINKLISKFKINGYDSTTMGNIPLYNSQNLFVIGYPQNTDNFYPIWKSGTIASEPNFLNVGISTFYIDATTRKGMSGSPVVFRDNKISDQKGGIQFLSSLSTILIGIYSAQNFDSELGVVTRIETIYNNLYKLAN